MIDFLSLRRNQRESGREVAKKSARSMLGINISLKFSCSADGLLQCRLVLPFSSISNCQWNCSGFFVRIMLYSHLSVPCFFSCFNLQYKESETCSSPRLTCFLQSQGRNWTEKDRASLYMGIEFGNATKHWQNHARINIWWTITRIHCTLWYC